MSGPALPQRTGMPRFASEHYSALGSAGRRRGGPCWHARWALGGVVITQRSADRREQENRANDAERERARWAREDESRTFEHRRDAYISYFEAIRDAVSLINQRHYHSPEIPGPLPSGWTGAMWAGLQKVDIYGSVPTIAIAHQAFDVITAFESFAASRQENEYNDDLVIDADNASWRFIEAAREELGVPSAQGPKTAAAPTTGIAAQRPGQKRRVSTPKTTEP